MLAQQVRPAPFTVSGGNGLGLTLSTLTQCNSLGDCSAMAFDDMKSNYGLLLGKPTNGICAEKATTVEEFFCHMDLASAYKKREWGFFNTIVTAELLNARNRFLLAIVSPIFETSEMNFTVENSTISAMPFTEIAECGIPEEPSGGYTYSWKETVSRYAQGCTFSRDLMLDPNFGAQFWLQMLSQFVSNARLTMEMGVITTAFQIGYENARRSRSEGCPVDHHKYWMAEAAGFFIMPLNPESGLDLIRNLEEDIPGLDTIIIPHGKSAYLRSVQGDSMTMMVQKLSTDPDARRAMVELAEGPMSFKTITLGDRRINIIEFTPFYVGNIGQDTKDCMRVNPFTTNVTIGHFFPPSPFIKIDECIKASCGDIHAIRIFNQTKTIGMFADITLAERLKNSIYYDKKTGKVSRTALDFARAQTKRRGTSPASIPWDWNTQNPEYTYDSNINRETTSNSEPNMAELNGICNLREMLSWRNEFVGLTYVPSALEFKIPKRFGDFHLRSIPNDYVKMAAEYLEAKFNEEHGGGALEDGFVQLKKLVAAIRHTPWTDAYLFGLLNKNVPKMIAVTGTADAPVYRLVPERTPLIRLEKHSKSNKNARDQCKFPDAAIIEEVKTNRFGGWDLPDRDGALLSPYPPGFDNAVGIQTLAQEALKEGSSLWFGPGKEAQESTLFGDKLRKFIEKYVGKTDLINSRLLPPWIHKASSLTQLLDSMIKSAGPVHVGVPATINYVENGPVIGVTTQKVNLTTGSVLRDTVADTRRYLEDAVRNNEPRIIINNETRAFACLSETVYAKMRVVDAILERLGGDDAFKSELYAALHKVYDYAIDICNSAKTATQHKVNVETISIIMDAFVEQLVVYVNALADEATLATDEARNAYRRDTVVKGLRAFVANFKNNSGMKRFLAEERKRLSPICVDYGEGFVEALRAYEKEPVEGRPINLSQGNGAFTNTVAPVYRADYTAAPAKWLRAPLASSQALRDYLRDKINPWILPSDYNLFYALPEEPRIVTGDNTVEVSVHKNRFELCSLARSKVFQCRLNSQKNMSAAPSIQRMDVDDNENDFFSSLKSKKSVSMGKILNMGKNYRDDDQEADDPYYRDAVIKGRLRQQQINPVTGEVELNSAMANEYFGPWAKRLEYKATEISSLGVAFFFNAIIQSKNRLETPVKLSAAGAVILDAMLIRPFIEVRTSAMLAMKAGSDTMITTIGHSHVQVTKEARGCWHIDVGFLMGVIKINPNNIMLIPHAFPESLLGGKGITFMTDFSQLRLPNPAKPSLISVLLGPDEREFSSPLHITNGDTMPRAGIDYAVHLRKHSAGQWMEWVLGAQTVANIDAGFQDRPTYAYCMPQANLLSQGPASYIDPRTSRVVDVEGNGAMGTFNMNMPGVQDVYEGKAHRFPDRLQMYAYQNS